MARLGESNRKLLDIKRRVDALGQKQGREVLLKRGRMRAEYRSTLAENETIPNLVLSDDELSSIADPAPRFQASGEPVKFMQDIHDTEPSSPLTQSSFTHSFA